MTGANETCVPGAPSAGPFEAVRGLRVEAAFPDMVRVRQHLETPAVPDIDAAVRAALDPLAERVRPGSQVAVTAGSRGIRDLAAVLSSAGAWLRERAATPFVVPAMGSHGGATAAGQLAVLEHLGITERRVGMPIRATMDTVELCTLAGGPRVLLDAYAAQADLILAVNRVKPHTDFHGPIESGVSKILAIGLGKQRGAEGIHAYGPQGLARWIPESAKAIVGTGKVLGGLAMVQNAAEGTAAVELLRPEEIGSLQETRLVEQAGALMGRLPFDSLDVLVVDEMGKDYSGAGMDPNVLGRMRIEDVPEPASPSIATVVVLGLSDASDGNAAGIGLADFTTLRLLGRLDVRTTYLNLLTSGLGGIRRGQLPLVLATDREAVAAALRCCGRPETQTARVVRVHDTLDLREMMVSSSLLAEAEDRRLEVIEKVGPLAFDAAGHITGEVGQLKP